MGRGSTTGRAVLYEGHTSGPVEDVGPREVGAGGGNCIRRPIPGKEMTAQTR